MGSNTDFSTLQGGQWKDQICASHSRGSDSKDLYNWLIDVNGSDSGLVKRGFLYSDSLTNKKGSEVATQIKQIITHDSPEALQKVLASLLFACPWDPSLLGHALCFLYKFCSKVQDGSLEEKLKGYSGKLKTVCQDLQRNLTPLVNGTYLSAVCQNGQNLFDGIWDDEHFDSYVSWLRKHLKNIIEALKAMSTECKNWSKEKLKEASSAGPFKYGFVFKDKSWMNRINENLPKAITSLIESLEKLEKALQTSSAGATAGGVFTGLLGTGGLGAGAAYATNAFGFQNFITSLISSFLK